MRTDQFMVTAEWAKQLAFAAYGATLDFASMSVVAVSGRHNVYKMVKVSEHSSEFTSSVPSIGLYYPQIHEYEVYMENYIDKLNAEVTMLGYEPVTNTLFLGPSCKYVKQKIDMYISDDYIDLFGLDGLE